MNTDLKLLCIPLLFVACSDPTTEPVDRHAVPPPSNRIDVPKAVRDNLGIEFAPVERRRVAATVRYPGQFELLPKARREYRAALNGHVDVRVEPLQRVAKGDVLCTIDSPDWHARQQELGELQTQVELDRARIDAIAPLLSAHEQHESSLAAAIEVLTARLGELDRTRRDLGGLAAEIAAASVELAQLRAAAAEAAEQHTATATRLVELRAGIKAGSERFALGIAAAAAITGIDREQLTERWREIDSIAIVAKAAGIVDTIARSAGSYVGPGDLVLSVTDPTRLRFKAHAPQREFAELPLDAAARVVPAHGDGKPIAGRLQLGIAIDVDLRMADVYVAIDAPPTWARPGLAAFVEIETASGGEAELAIPRRALQRDGLVHVFFRRDDRDPDKVIRVEADLGVDDGHWVEIKSDLADGDEVVVAGTYELVLASSQTVQKGGHFHADGSWHGDEHK
ncbi:MAG: efflux RND transporter periplasmic adaptor subunit [Planctomycetes bacterium]|nr:efflux RND transporter periplasmic adaptor subunit [Planctomycetota bacterium]